MVMVCNECAKRGVRGGVSVQEVSVQEVRAGCKGGERRWCAMSVQRGVKRTVGQGACKK